MLVEDLTVLLQPQAEPCLSIYLPTHAGFPDAEEDPIRFKNLVGRAEALLRERLPAREVARLLEPISALPGAGFWRAPGAGRGLALFRSPSTFRVTRLPVAVTERVVIGDSFHTKPLFRALARHRPFFVLALSGNAIVLHAGSASGLEPLEVEGLPARLRDVIGDEEWVDDSTFHAGFRGGGQAPVMGGQGGPEALERKRELERAFRRIDEPVARRLRGEPGPLVLACVPYYRALYRAACRSPRLLEHGVDGNADHWDRKTLHRRAWPIVREHYAERDAELQRTTENAIGVGRGSIDLREIAAAARQGRVWALLVAEGRRLAGRLDRATGAVEIDPAGASDAADVLDDVAEMAWIHGAEVAVLPPGRMPYGAPLAARYRY